MMRRFWLSLAIALGSLLLVVLLVVTRPEANTEVKPPPIPRVEVTRVSVRDILPEVEVTGVLRPWQSARLRFEVAGEVRARHVEPGQQVSAGEILLELDEADYADALIETKSQFDETRATLKRDRALLDLARENRRLAEREYQRLEKLGEGSLASQSTREGARQKLLALQSEEASLEFSLESNQARVDRQQAALNRAERNLRRTRLIAPFAGLINQVLVEVGDYVPPNTQVVELIDSQSLELQVSVSGDVAAALSLGQALDVRVDERPVSGRLVALQIDPDPQTHTHPMRVRIEGEGLLPGQLGRVGVPLRPRSGARVVPATALLQEDGYHYVFIVDQNRLQRRRVTPGIRQGDWQVIRKGVNEGETLVARDVDVLSPDLQVQIEGAVQAGD
ncbi:MAG: efflux RND transporter periplasmic adaptor subunit [Candidatus Thiodiazotropha sp.]